MSDIILDDKNSPQVRQITENYLCDGRRFGISFRIDTRATAGKKQNVLVLQATEDGQDTAAADISAVNEKLKALWALGSLDMWCHRNNSSAEFWVEGPTISDPYSPPGRTIVSFELPRSTPSRQ